MSNPVTLEVTQGGEVRVRLGAFSYSPSEARDIGNAIVEAGVAARVAREQHDRHGFLRASCILCRHEAGTQTDRLDGEPEPAPAMTAERFSMLAMNNYTTIETRKNGRKRTTRGDMVNVVFDPTAHPNTALTFTIADKAGRLHSFNPSEVHRLDSTYTVGHYRTLIRDGQLVDDVWLQR